MAKIGYYFTDTTVGTYTILDPNKLSGATPEYSVKG